MKQQSYRGGAGNFANDPERAKEAGSTNKTKTEQNRRKK
jgi:general stress protein YciG